MCLTNPQGQGKGPSFKLQAASNKLDKLQAVGYYRSKQKGIIMEINSKEIADWVNDCPTHKIEVLYSDENGIQLLVNFNNEKDKEN